MELWSHGRWDTRIWRGPGGGFRPGFGDLEVSEDFTANVTAVAKSDSDVQNLLANGYNITLVRPMIKTVVDGQGNVITKATGAIVELENSMTSRATVLVDLENAKVARIVTMARTVIEK